MQAGFQVSNLVSSNSRNDPVHLLPLTYLAGIGKSVSPAVRLGVEIIKQEYRPASIQPGLVYQLNEQVQVRMGYQTAPNMPWWGISYATKGYQLSLHSRHHQQLGAGFLLSLQFSAQKDPDEKNEALTLPAYH